jgi:hypothetical protein
VGLLRERDHYREWAQAQASALLPPWRTCEAVLAETFYLLGTHGSAGLIALLRRRALLVSFDFGREQEPVLNLMEKYAEVPMSLADACLVRITEAFADPLVLTTDSHFRIYRRHSRQVVPCVLPD